MPGIVIEPRLIYLECAGPINSRKFYLKATPLSHSRHIEGDRRGARKHDELYFSEDRLRGMRLPNKTSREFLSFLLQKNPLPIFPGNLSISNFAGSKKAVSSHFLQEYEAKHPHWKARYKDKTRVVTHVGNPPANTAEVWSLFDPRDSSKKKASPKTLYDISRNLRLAKTEDFTSEFYKNGTWQLGVLPLGIAYRTRLYYGRIPQTVANHLSVKHTSKATEHIRSYLGNPEGKTEEWVAIAALPRRNREDYTLTPLGMRKTSDSPYIEIRINKVQAENAEDAVKKITKIYDVLRAGTRSRQPLFGQKPRFTPGVRRDKEVDTKRQRRAEYLYAAWEMNDFKVVPAYGVSNYRPQNRV